MADHYKILGISNSATKDQIKQAFRKLAVQFHPDKHAQSPKSTRDAATLKFKQVSEAYEVLIDDRKRSDYNISRYSHNSNHHHQYSSNQYHSSNQYGYGRDYYNRGGSYYRPPPPRSSSSSIDEFYRFMMSRGFVLTIAFSSVVLCGAAAIDLVGEALWKIQNPGKSFEEAMESIEKNKVRKEDKQ